MLYTNKWVAVSKQKLCKKPSAHWLQFPTLVPKDGNGKKLKNSFFSEAYKPHLVMGLLLLKEDNFGPVPLAPEC